MVYVIEKARRLHRLNNETGEPAIAKRKKKEAGKKAQAAQNCKTEVAEEL
jgi:hypothetical protein